MMGYMGQLGQLMGVGMFIWAIFPRWFHDQFSGHVEKYVHKLIGYFYPYIQISFHEYNSDSFARSKAYAAIERYLSANSSSLAKRLKANVVKDCESVVLSMDDYEEVTDEYNGVKIWWTSSKTIPQQQSLFSYRDNSEKRDEGKAIAVRTRQRKLYTNNKSDEWHGYMRTTWSHIIFDHPSTFDTLAMDPKKKEEILNDLLTFSKSKDYYKKVGKSWKRGYLLYGPPGTGKSSMIAAMANLLEYDIYDLELASVKDNTDLRKLLIETSSKSIIVIEDIDCSLDLTGQRKEKQEHVKREDTNPIRQMEKMNKKKGSEVTLSGLLNFIDGLWSACGSERLVVFTTNHIEKLDPALIRRGRMDKHIEMSYCCFETFKVLARNYLDVKSHELFATIGRLLGETNMTPADVVECLTLKSDEEDVEICLKKLIKSLEDAKEEARLKVVEGEDNGDQKLQECDESSESESSDSED
ncbi:hypothetical protein M8C21_011611 [Ambrosia artemisiifolia]|uniref:AAA+ ATPase domain-containing protein n=1 Tax=Ambrosia artemisiifolia TaxID=4212 RepID=A0AAD5CIP8_AMBAR|nr:hypothetical protein M8C21_011611 [Ambrosia artemisiifolia]